MIILNWLCLISFCILVSQIMVNFCKEAILDIEKSKVKHKRKTKRNHYVQDEYYLNKVAK